MSEQATRPALQAAMSVTATGRVLRALVIGLTAFLTVVDLFAAQALLPALTVHYGVSPGSMGLAVNACTLGMALGGLGVALFGRRVDRRSGILVSLVLLAIPTSLLAFAPSLPIFAGLRILQGLCMSIAFGLTLGYLGDRYSAEDAAGVFAAYITGNVASNLVGRLVAAAVVDHAGLAANFFVFAALNIAGAVLVYATVQRVPPMRAVESQGAAEDMQAWRAHLADPLLRIGFGIGFCILFAFIGTFTYVNFVLARPPLSIGMMELGLVYFVFLPSIFTTPLAGSVVERLGTRGALWGGLGVALAGLPLLVVPRLWAVLAGMVLIAVGTFFAQAVATGFVSRTARRDRAAASGIYLASYFAGGLFGAAVLGQLFDRWGWEATVIGLAIVLGAAAALTVRLEGYGPRPRS